MFVFETFIVGILGGTYASINSIITSYGYYAVFGLMFLESTGIPIPSEVILPLTGHFVYTGAFNAFYAFAIVLASSMLGIAFDYYAAYYLGKDVVYKHLHFFHINKESLDAFEKWFNENGPFTVFISRFIPEVRALVSIPAGFAMMNQKQFFVYSFFGALIWDIALMAFGYYALSTSNVTLIFASMAGFVIVLYVIYRHFIRQIKSKKR